MLTTGVASADPASNVYLRATLLQTGLVCAVQEWIVTASGHPIPEGPIPDVVLLDLTSNETTQFEFAVFLRRLRPAVRIIVCSSEASPDPNLLLQAMRSGAQEFLHKPLSPPALRETLARFVLDRQGAESRPAQKLFLVLGAKGGVGATTLAANLAIELHRATHKRCVLLDFGRPLGQATLLLDIQPSFSLRDAAENLDRLDGHFFNGLLSHHKSGLELLAGTSHPEEWQKISAAALVRIVNVAQSSAEIALVDCGTHYSEEFAPLLREAAGVLLVSEANLASLWALQRHVDALAGLGVRRDQFRIVLNRWRRADDEAVQAVEKNMKLLVFARIPNDFRQASEAMNQGAPLVGSHNSAIAARYRELASQLVSGAKVVPEKRSGLAGLFTLPTTR
jgi:pilus assembly protein CpaE